ncbi:hypothetical protein ACP70R_047062 [Stipagrostis hirtigluma subsp. patula]
MAFAALFDPLYCPEEHLDLYLEDPGELEDEQWPEPEQQRRPAALDDELPALFEAFRGRERAVVVAAAAEDGYGGAAAREAAVGWASRAAARLGFSALTAALAASYLDRCFLGGALRLGPLADQPWMARLAAVACVTLAAKVEEINVPQLYDLQVIAAGDADADAGEAVVWEPKMVRRMELLVLSALEWRMHHVTPLSYLQPLLADAAVRLHHCGTVLLAAMADCRWPRHRPSAWAAAALLATASDADDDAELLALINAAEDEVAECAQIIAEATGMAFIAGDGGAGGNKRKHAAARMYSPPPSPSGVIGAAACFSCESSSSSMDSRLPATAAAAWPSSAPVSVSSSPEPSGRAPKRAATAALPPDEESRDAWPSTCAA